MSTGSMTRRRRSFTRFTSAALAAAGVGLVLVVLAAVGAFSGSSTVGQVKLHLTAATSPAVRTPNAQQYPFGAPSGTPDYTVPPPPGESSLVTTVGTKTTQRIYGANPYQEAVSVTQHIWPAALPENAPNENNNVPDRPWGLTLLTPNNPLPALPRRR